MNHGRCRYCGRDIVFAKARSGYVIAYEKVQVFTLELGVTGMVGVPVPHPRNEVQYTAHRVVCPGQAKHEDKEAPNGSASATYVGE